MAARVMVAAIGLALVLSACSPEDTSVATPDGLGPDTVSADLALREVEPRDSRSDADRGTTDERGGEAGAGDLPAELGACETGSGCFGDPCKEGKDCISGLCVDHMGERVCSKFCVEECPDGFACTEGLLGGPDVVFACVSGFPTLCRPCASDADCASAGSQKSRCVVYPGEGTFCGGACDEQTECPAGFACVTATAVGGATLQHCLAVSGVCECSATSVALALATPCTASNEWGQCQGQRACTDEGLTDCDAPAPAPEACNGSDDDCDGVTDEETCDDSNPCTEDGCVPGEGCLHQQLDGEACDDADSCTVGDKCAAGKCSGNQVMCNDGNPCTLDLCDENTGCSFEPTSDPCSDGDPCTFGDSCADGECKPGLILSCDDQNPCTKDACDEGKGCSYEGLAGPCDDGNACTVGDKCVDGKCAYSALADCSDDNACTNDWCAPGGQCEHTPNAAVCDDGNLCTLGDLCADGLCVSGDPMSCDDHNPCTKDSCNALLGCLHTNTTDPCDDLDPCTLTDKCVGGQCVGIGALPCEDDNVCTQDYCDPMAGCTHMPGSGTCDDGNPCTFSDKCQAGTCVGGKPMACDDGNLCTKDSCSAQQGCLHQPAAGPCDDQNDCTNDDHCDGGACISLQSVKCDDGNPCTTDLCLPDGGCSFQPNTAPCTDGNACTLDDTCKGGKCLPGPTLKCDDGNPCTADACQAGLCEQTPAAGACDDGNACTAGDTCKDGKCAPGSAIDCSDNTLCTTDYCEPLTGCAHKLNESPCDDGDPCTTGDKCQLGLCKPGAIVNCDDANPCTADACAGGGCVHAPAAGACDDGNACTTGDACKDGKCKGAGPLGCDDGNLCTTDTCDPATGCVTTLNTAPCDDGNLCTTGDQCAAGKCAGPGKLACNDGNPCTDDSCLPESGCAFTPNSAACDDKNACTLGDHCLAGFCVPDAMKECGDSNPCTKDACDTQSGCQNVPQAGACDDGNACTLNDSCQAGKCTGGDALVCNDGKACTQDTCAPLSGCVYPPIVPCCGNGSKEAGEECDDGNLTPGDGCDASCKSEGVNTPECKSYATLSEGNRNVSFNDGDGNVEICDSSLSDQWYRFSGAAGTKMPTSCPSIYSCGTDAPGWMNGAHPAVADGIVDRTVCFNWSGNCCEWSRVIKVRNCGDFYVFKISGTPACHLRYCGAN